MSNTLRPTTLSIIATCALATTLTIGCGPSGSEPGATVNIDADNAVPPLEVAQANERRGWGRPPRDASAAPPDGSDSGQVDAGGAQMDTGGATEAGPTFDGGSASLALHVSGNHLVDASGKPIVLRGADVSGTEFVCAQNYTADPYGGAPLASVATFAAMRAWNLNVIRLPLNEDCWLDINGVEIGGATYQSAIEAEVSAAHAAGLFVIIDLHWTAPGSQRALSQNPEPDADHSPAFWASVASTFAPDPGVIFDLFNEPYDYWGTDPDPWDGWLNGDTQTQYITGGSPYQVTSSWKTAGMQQLVTAVRAAGATQPILVNGLDWANDDSGWLTHVPSDPLNQIVAGAHIYPGESCDTAACWTGVFPAIEAKYPVLIGETGDSSPGPVTFLPTFLTYADAQGWNYLGWTWNPWQDTSNVLITDWTGAPTAGEGAAWQSHALGFPFQN
jgi:endoglucanase